MGILKNIFRKNKVERGFRYLVKPEYLMSIVVKEVICELRDISTSGVGLISKELGKSVSKGDEVQASIKIGDEIITLDLLIVWCRGNRLGVKVITHKDFYSQKVTDFISSHI